MSTTTATSTTNGTTSSLRPDAFDFDAWRALTERALQEGERRLAAAHAQIARARADVVALEGQMGVLRRALALEPAPPEALPSPPAPPAPPADPADGVPLPAPPAIRKGERTGHGTGAAAAVYLLELARIRVRTRAEHRHLDAHGGRAHPGHAAVDLAVDGEDALTPDAIRLGCKGWYAKTAYNGMRWLVAHGLLARTKPGFYRLTEAGLAFTGAGETPAPTLPLLEPHEATEPV